MKPPIHCRKSNLFALLVAAAVAAGAFAPSSAAADPETAVHVVVLGSSTAAGVGPSHPDSGWVNRYRAALQAINPGHQVTNLAVGGYTTWHVRENGVVPPPGRPNPDTAHNVTKALELDPDVIIVNLPSNDVTLGFWITEQIMNYDSVRSKAAAVGVPVWFTTSQPRNLNQAGRDSLANMFVTTLALYGHFAIDFWTGIAESNGEIRDEFDSGDGIHLNDAAHAILFERVLAEGIQDFKVLGVAPRPARSPLALAAPYPQPAGGPVTLRYTLERPMRVELSLVDVGGRRIATLDEGPRAAGAHRATWDASRLPGGIYFAVLDGEDGARATRRLAVVR